MDEKIQVFERKRFFSGNRIKFLDSIHTTSLVQGSVGRDESSWDTNHFKTSSYNNTRDLVLTLRITLRITRYISVKQFENADNTFFG